jgi:predicted porin
MKKLLIGTAAIALVASFAASPANAQVKLSVGGHTKLYGSWLSQTTANDDLDTVALTPPTTATSEQQDNRSVDILRETELHFTGETTLDNGLTVGFHSEIDLDGTDAGANDGLHTEESYAYFSGAWGRVNLGKEDGAAYLLQVAAPSADSNFDGIRQFIDPVNNTIMAAPATRGGSTVDNVSLNDIFTGGSASALNGMDGAGSAVGDVGTVLVDGDGTDTATAGDIRLGSAGGLAMGTRFDYDQAMSGFENKLTYMTPVFNGFQAGVSYTPELNAGSSRDYANNDSDGAFPTAAMTGAGTALVRQYGNVWEVGARWEGMLGEVGVALGAGYTHASLEYDNNEPVFYQDVDAVVAPGYTAGDIVLATFDDREAWDVGLDLDWKAFGLGAAYTVDDNGVSGDEFETKTWVVGADYTTGPFKLGATYYNQDQNVATAEVNTDRYTGGVVYTYGPGMTFRGSVSYVDFDENIGYANSSADATSVLLGTQIDF